MAPSETDERSLADESLIGLYRHYKGGRYEVLGIALEADTHEQLVVYRTLDAGGTFPMGSLWVRPKAIFLEMVLAQGKLVPRFERLIETSTQSVG